MTERDTEAMAAAQIILLYDWVGMYPEKEALFVARAYLAAAKRVKVLEADRTRLIDTMQAQKNILNAIFNPYEVPEDALRTSIEQYLAIQAGKPLAETAEGT